MATDQRARSLGFDTPGPTDLIRNGDNAISKNARTTVDLFDKSIGAISNLTARGETLPIGSALAVTMSGPLAQKVINIGIPRAIQASVVPGLLDYASTATAPVTVLSENFNRTTAELVGTSPQIGAAWTGGAAGRWTANGSTASAAGTAHLWSNVGQAAVTLTVALSVVSSGTGTAQIYRVHLGTNATSAPPYALWVSVTIGSTGTVVASLWKTIGGASTNLGACPLSLTANSATPQTLTVQLTLSGTAVTLDCGAGVVTATLTPEDVAALSTNVGFVASTSGTTGLAVDSVTATRPRVASDSPGSPRLITADAEGRLPGVVLDQLDERFGLAGVDGHSAIEVLRALRGFGSGDATVAVVSDSTSNDPNDWVRVWVRKWSATLPASLRVEYTDWDRDPAVWRETIVDTPGTGTGTLAIRNAGIAGGKLSTFTAAKRAEQFGSLDPDVLLFTMGHNHAAQTASSFVDEVAAWLAAWRAEHPECTVVISSQNPEFSPAVNVEAHRARQAALRTWAKANGYDYVPTFEEFTALPDGGASLVGDGIHPTTPPGDTTTGNYGAVKWADIFTAVLNS